MDGPEETVAASAPPEPITPALAAMGCSTLHDGEPLPPGVVWAQPDTAFCPPGVDPGSTMPPLGPGPTTASRPTSAP